jgi:hypothetical protein
VLLISGPELPAIPWLTIDTGRGKLTSFRRLKSEQGRGALRDLLARRISFRRLSAARDRQPRLFAEKRRASIPVSLCHVVGLWSCRAVGGAARLRLAGADRDRFNHAEGRPRVDGPKELPAQMLDHATGYFMAFGAMMAKAARRAKAAAGTSRCRWRRPGAGCGISGGSMAGLTPVILRGRRIPL